MRGPAGERKGEEPGSFSPSVTFTLMRPRRDSYFLDVRLFGVSFSSPADATQVRAEMWESSFKAGGRRRSFPAGRNQDAERTR